MRKLLIAAAALFALLLPTSAAQGDRGGRHWRSGGPSMHMQGHRGFSRPVWRGQWQGHRGFNRHIRHGQWRGQGQWRGHPGFAPGFGRHAWRGQPRWRHRGNVVIVGGGFGGFGGFGGGFGWGHTPPCRTLWFDGWGWRCGW